MESSINIEEYLKRFKVYHNATLFDPNWKALKESRCPLCGNKLKIPLYKKIVFCNSKKHKTFVIDKKRLNYIVMTMP